MKILAKLLETLLDIIIFAMIIIIILASIYVFQINILKKQYPNILGYSGFEVVSGSMSGTIEIGDLIIVRLTNDFKENDVIVYKEDNSFITHRLMKLDGDKATTKGDANNSEDKEIQKSQIIGKVTMIIPKIFLWKKILFTPQVFISVIAIITLSGIFFIFNGNNKNKKDDTNVKQKET